MAVYRIITVTFPVASDTTHVNIQFGTDGSTWTPFDPVSASPSSPADIAVGSLTSSAYTIDGVNSPAGNEQAASAAGNLFQIRLKNSAGYSNWSGSFFAQASPAYYAQPSAAQVMAWTGITRYIAGQATDSALQTALADYLAQAEMLTALEVGESVFDSVSLTTRKALALQYAVAHRTAALFLLQPELQAATGTAPALLMEDPETLEATALAFEEMAGRYGKLVATGDGPEQQQALLAFSDSDDEDTRTFTMAGTDW